VDRQRFELLVEEAIRTVPIEFRQKIDNVAFIVEDFPNYLQMRKAGIRNPFGLLGLYEGVSQLRRRNNYNAVMPDKITIFQKPIEMIANDDESLKKIIQNTVKHEIAHHFGMNEEEVQRAQSKSK
jgi:predicted Zn-dependent protease with MMP-like domain